MFFCVRICVFKFIFIQKDVRVKIKHTKDCLKFQVFLKKILRTFPRYTITSHHGKTNFTLSPLSREFSKKPFFYLPKTQFIKSHVKLIFKCVRFFKTFNHVLYHFIYFTILSYRTILKTWCGKLSTLWRQKYIIWILKPNNIDMRRVELRILAY